MNIIDIAILAILFISIAYGVYKGFMHALLSLGCGLLAFILALVFSPALARNLSNSPSISSTLATYTDSFARVENYDLKNLPVDQLNEGSIDQILLDHVNLPPIIENALKDNLLSGALQNKGIYSVNDYVSNTIVSIALSILSFIVCYIVIYLILSLLVNIINHVFKLPLLKQMDWLAGGALGLLRGAVLLYVLFLSLPLISTIVPIDALQELVSASTLAPIFQSDGLFATVISKL
ncbi:MAG: CvpA family protein [Clostridia bacterium]|nr:CvpA family protein [Clostridia bacterium]